MYQETAGVFTARGIPILTLDTASASSIDLAHQVAQMVAAVAATGTHTAATRC